MDGSTRNPSLDELLDQERWLHALARRLVRDAATADDLVQETWFRTLSARHDPRPGSATGVSDVRSWLGRVLRNVWRERGRAERARSGREARVAASEDSPSARESLERFGLRQRLAALVLELDEPFRSVVIWRYYEGRSAAAIASELGEPAARVRWRLMRARELLRRRLDRDRNDWSERYALFLPLAQRNAPTTPAVASAAGLGTALSIGIKPVLWAGAGVLLVWALARLGAPGSSGRPTAPTPGGTLLASPEEAASAEELAQAVPESAPREPAPAFAVPAAAGPDASLGRVRGVVKAAEDGRMLPGAEVALIALGHPVRNGIRSGPADSFLLVDAAGSFLFAEVQPGRYRVACRLEGRRPSSLPEFELSAGEERVLEVGLELGFPVSVEVSERSSGAPVAGARVELIAGSRDAVVWYSAVDRRFHGLSGVTSPQGRVELDGAARGTHQYSVQAGEHATALGEALIEPGDAPLRILLDRGGVVHGVVRHASGLPAEGARVFLNPVLYVRGLDELIFRQNGLATGRDGSYRLEGVPEGVYYAVALLPDGSGSFHFDPEENSERDLGRILVENSAEVPLDFSLPAPGRVRGTVLDGAGAAIPGATVSVSWGDFKPGRARFFPIASVPGVKESIHHSQQTDAEGRFAIDALRISHRALKLRVHCAGFVEEELELDVPPGALLEPVVTLRRLGATITGRLTDADGAPVAGQTVGAWETGGEKLGDFFHAKSAADGTYVLDLPHEPKGSGLHRVQPSLFDSSPLRSDPELREGVPTGASGVDFVLHAKRRLHGTVVDDSGTAVRDFVVHGLERVAGSAESWKACTDANRGEGRFDLFVNAEHLVQLRFSAPGCDPGVLTDLEDPSERRIVLRRAGDLVGIVLDGEGRAVSGAVVALATLDSAIYPKGTEFAPRDTTDAEGRFRLRGVPDPSASGAGGTPASSGHLLVCPRRDDAPPLLHYPLPAQRGADLELVLPRCMPVELEFVDADGNPIEGIVLVIDPEGWPMEPVFETHLSDQANPERGLLHDGRTRFCLRPGLHHAILIRGAEAKEALPFEVEDEGRGAPAMQERSFTVGR